MFSAVWPQCDGICRPPRCSDRLRRRRRRAACRAASRRAAGTARGRDSRDRTSRSRACSVMPAATSIASWPAPLIWKKIWLWFLSWISLSSSLRDRTHAAVGVEQSRRGRDRRTRAAAAWTACRSPLTTAPFISPNYSIRSSIDISSPCMSQTRRSPASVGRNRARKSHRDAVAQDRHRRARDARRRSI